MVIAKEGLNEWEGVDHNGVYVCACEGDGMVDVMRGRCKNTRSKHRANS